jgi:uncharacterized membrane protein HdeD (DUF308 family)
VTPLYNRTVIVIAVLMIVLGFAILVRTAAAGGGTVGYLIGALFVALGAGRIHLQRKMRRGA